MVPRWFWGHGYILGKEEHTALESNQTDRQTDTQSHIFSLSHTHTLTLSYTLTHTNTLSNRGKFHGQVPH